MGKSVIQNLAEQMSKITINSEGEGKCLQRGDPDSDTITTHEPYEIGSTATSAYL
jgi:hypothetical protein